ncbi:MAG: PAT family beta-lactamase induction signal transducer AmpG [Candidatus Endobugula sp.]|jgi:PAT family beta-lactamase induction signal transducer AmpG
MTFKQYLMLYKDKRLLVIFALGALSGFPWVLIGSAMTAWLQEAGLTRSAIGFFGSVFVVYAINFLWAPLLDAYKVPFLSKLGRRRSWIVAMQLVILISVLCIAFTNPALSLVMTSLLALLIAVASSTQDIAIDAYRIETLSEDETNKVPAAAAMATSGWWTGYSLPGAVALILSDQAGIEWKHVYLVMSLFVVASIIFVARIKEPTFSNDHVTQSREGGVFQHVRKTILAPLIEFFQRNGIKLAVIILLFVFSFKIGEAFLGRMSIVFYKEVGFSNTDIGIYSKMIGWWVIIVFSFLASMLNIRFGILKGLLISGIAMAATNLMFTWIALVGPDKTLFAATIIVDNFTASFATVAFVSFISSLTHRAYTATQYALLASLGNLGRTTLAASSGLLVDSLNGNWALFFVLTALMVVPALLLLRSLSAYPVLSK